jgi:GMP synthase (glutamine-hydrolysing)
MSRVGDPVPSLRVLAISHQRDAGPGVFAEAIEGDGHRLDVWHSAESDRAPAEPAGYDAVIVLGGAMHVDHEAEHPWLTAEKRVLSGLLREGVPLLGVCLGSQLLAEAAGGGARAAARPEIGWFDVEVSAEGAADPLIGPLAPRFEAFEWHSYECLLPDGAVPLASSPLCTQAFRVGPSAWGIQFHAEVSRADAEHWVVDYRSDPDAIRIGIDPSALAAETAPRIEAWNELGRELSRRFCAIAATRE